MWYVVDKYLCFLEKDKIEWGLFLILKKQNVVIFKVKEMLGSKVRLVNKCVVKMDGEENREVGLFVVKESVEDDVNEMLGCW